MINWMIKKYGGMKPVQLDGALYVIIAVCSFIDITLKADSVYKYMNAYLVFYSGFGFGIIGAAALALKMFRSTQYKDHRDAEDAKATLDLPDSVQTITQQQTTKVETTNEKVIDHSV